MELSPPSRAKSATELLDLSDSEVLLGRSVHEFCIFYLSFQRPLTLLAASILHQQFSFNTTHCLSRVRKPLKTFFLLDFAVYCSPYHQKSFPSQSSPALLAISTSKRISHKEETNQKFEPTHSFSWTHHGEMLGRYRGIAGVLLLRSLIGRRKAFVIK